MSESPNTPGLCACGCGGRTYVPSQNDPRRGWVKGHPTRYLAGHNARCAPKDQIARLGALSRGRPRSDETKVHHVDHNRKNNDPENLMVFASSAEHTAFHQALERERRSARSA